MKFFILVVSALVFLAGSIVTPTQAVSSDLKRFTRNGDYNFSREELRMMIMFTKLFLRHIQHLERRNRRPFVFNAVLRIRCDNSNFGYRNAVFQTTGLVRRHNRVPVYRRDRYCKQIDSSRFPAKFQVIDW